MVTWNEAVNGARGCYSQNNFTSLSKQDTQTGSECISDSKTIHAIEMKINFEERVYCVGYQSTIAHQRSLHARCAASHLRIPREMPML